MKPTVNLGDKHTLYNDGLDSLVVVNCLGDVPSGSSLDVSSGLPAGAKMIQAGHIIVKTSTGSIKPLAVTGKAYAEKGTTDTYLGVLKHSVLVSDPRAAILTIGQVNAAACPFPITDAIVKGLPRIEFINIPRKTS